MPSRQLQSRRDGSFVIRVLVTGSRDWPDRELVWDQLYKILGEFGRFTLVHGDCLTGADNHADEWGIEVGLDLSDNLERHPADWKGPRKRGAGYARNAEMVNLGADLCLAFIKDESNGATHCSQLAEEAGIPTQYFRTGTGMAKELDRTPILKPRPYKRVDEELTLRNYPIKWRNFAGEERLYNAKGKRNFAVDLEEADAIKFHEAGWTVKEKIADDGTHYFHLPVTVKMDGRRPPRIFLITMSKNKRTPLDEETVHLADVVEFDRVDVTLRPFNWDVSGQQGVAAYLKIFMGTLHEDELELEYAHVPIEGDPEEEIATLQLENLIDAQVEEDSGWVEDGERRAITA